jgi:hypothetical protein
MPPSGNGNPMKYFFSIIIFLMLVATRTNASELTGKISTDPQILVNIVNGTSSGQDNGSQNNIVSVSSGGSTNAAATSQTPELGNNYQTIYATAGKKGNRQIKILGISLYPDNSLLRNIDHRIYLVKGGFKKPVLSPKELQQYRGQGIYDVTPEELAYYQTRGHLDGELIKEKGRREIYVIVNGKRQRISSPADLQKHYRGVEVFSISHEEMNLYK